MKRLERGSDRRTEGDRRKEAAPFWREDLERRGGSSRRREKIDRRTGSGDRRQERIDLIRRQKRNRILGKSSRKWVDTSVVHETISMLSQKSLNRIKLCSMIELGRCGQESDMGIYVDDVLAGAITHNDEWHVWRLIEECDVHCASELRMYMDRLLHLAAFPSLKAAKNFVRGPFKRYIFAETKTARTVKAV